MSLVETTVKIPNAVGKEEPYTRSREDVEAWAVYGNLDTVKVSAKVILIQITLLNLLCHFALAFSCFLRILQLKSVLVHRESHGLADIRLVWVQPQGTW